MAAHGLSRQLLRLIGLAAALESLLASHVFLPEEAMALCAVRRVCAPEQLLNQVLAVLQGESGAPVRSPSPATGQRIRECAEFLRRLLLRGMQCGGPRVTAASRGESHPVARRPKLGSRNAPQPP